MLRVVIWIGNAGRGFGPVGVIVGTLVVAGAGYLTGANKDKLKKKKKGFWI